VLNGGTQEAAVNFLSSTLNLTNVIVGASNGIAANGGAGIFNEGDLVMKSGSVTEVSSGNNGGGLYNLQGTASFNNVTFSHDSATDEGGAIWNCASTVKLTGTTSIHNSQAGIEGGGIWEDTLATTDIGPNVTITGNTPDNIFHSPTA
jgi:hypothetical protein